MNVVGAPWISDARLAMTRVDEARSALASLVDDPAAARITREALADGAAFDDPFEAARSIAEDGTRGLWDGWSKATAATSILGRAVAKHPAGAGSAQLAEAHAITASVADALDGWIASGGTDAPLESIVAAANPLLERAGSLANLATWAK